MPFPCSSMQCRHFLFSSLLCLLFSESRLPPPLLDSSLQLFYYALRMTARRLLILMLLCWCAAIAGTPILASMGGWGGRVSLFLYELFSRVCHQIDARSFHLAGHKFAVCVRCTAIYCSFFLGVLLYPGLSTGRAASIPMPVLLPISLVPMGIDVLLATLGIHESNDFTRLATGSIFGLVLSIALTAELQELTGRVIQSIRRKLPGQRALRADASALRGSHLLASAAAIPSDVPAPSYVHPQRTSYATKT